MEGLFIRSISAEIHRTNHLLDERDVTNGETIFQVEVFVCPPLRPLLHRHERVDLARYVLGWLMQKNQEASEPTGKVGQDAFSVTP